MMKRITTYVLIACLTMLPACSLFSSGSSTATTANVCNDVATAQAALTVAQAAVTFINANPSLLTPANLAQARLACAAAATTTVSLSTLLVDLNDADGNLSSISVEQWTVLLVQLGTDGLNLYETYSNLSGAPKVSILRDTATSATPTPVACTMTDAQIQQALAFSCTGALAPVTPVSTTAP